MEEVQLSNNEKRINDVMTAFSKVAKAFTTSIGLIGQMTEIASVGMLSFLNSYFSEEETLRMAKRERHFKRYRRMMERGRQKKK